MRGNRSRSRNRGASDTDDLELALQRLVGKLKGCEPFYVEEDVAVIPFPADAGSSSNSPSRSPARHDSCGAGSAADTVPGSREEMDRGDKPAASAGSASSKGVVDGKKLATSPAPVSSVPAAKAQASSGPAGPSPAAASLDQPLSAGLFLAAVNVLEPKMIGKSRRTSTDTVKLIQQGYALVWHDPQYVTYCIREQNSVSGGQSGSNSTRPFGSRGPSVGMLDGGTSPGKRGAMAADPPPATKSRSPAPTFVPEASHVLLLDQAVQSLLVYANASFFLSQHLTSQETVLRLLCFICYSARRVEEAEIENEEELTVAHVISSSTAATGGRQRDLERELAELESVWASCGLAGRIVGYLRECYLTDFLLDACLPPAVCSSRYEGVASALYEKKQRILTDMVTSRYGFASMMKLAPLRGLVGVMAMAAYAEAKVKARLLDKMASEGLVDRLFREIGQAREELQTNPSASSEHGGLADTRTSCARSRSASEEAPRLSPSRPSPGKRGRPPLRNSTARVSPERKASRQTSPGRSSPLSPQPSQHAGSAAAPVTAVLDPVERLGYCTDLLLLLTSPNLRPPSEADELARNPKTAASAVVRSTVWADHEEVLRGITVHLMWVSCDNECRRRYPRLSALRSSATECVLQLTAYSGLLYGMVVTTVDALLKASARRSSGCDTAPDGDGTLASRTPSRSPARVKNGRAVSQRSTTPLSAPSPTTVAALAPSVLLLDDPSGLLPLFVGLLRHPTHAQANADSIRRWFRWLADHTLPHVFEAPPLTNGRRSSSAWGKQRRELQLRQASEMSSAATRIGKDLAAPVLARNLLREEMTQLSPYFSFTVRLLTETTWRDGAESFLARVALLAYHVVLTNARRCNLCFGQASACYDLVAPLLLPVGGVIPGDTAASAREASTGAEAEQTPLKTPSNKKRRGRGASAAALSSPGRGDEESDGNFQLFIPSPSRSPVFYEAYSPAASEVTFIGDRSPSLSSPTPARAASLRGSVDRNGDRDTEEEKSEDGGNSPLMALTQSWGHSLKMLISSISSPEEATLRRD